MISAPPLNTEPDAPLKVIPPPTCNTSWKITGNVTSQASNLPISNATITLYDFCNAFPQRFDFDKQAAYVKDTTTDQSGYFQFDAPAYKHYFVTVFADGYIPELSYSNNLHPHELIRYNPNQSEQNRQFKLKKGGSVYVTVVDKNGKPLPHVDVYCFINSYLLQYHSKTDDNGFCQFTSLPQNVSISRYSTSKNQAVIFCRKNGYAAQCIPFSICTANPSSLKIILTEPRTVQGIVKDNRGNPIAHHPVYFLSNWVLGKTSLFSLDPLLQSVHTDEKGYYCFNNLGEGKSIVSPDPLSSDLAYKKQYATPQRWVNLMGNNKSTTVDFVLNKLSRMTQTGRIESRTGNPIEGATIQIHVYQNAEMDTHFSQNTLSGYNGQFNYDITPDTTHVDISALASGFLPKWQTITSNLNQVNIILEPSSSITGKIIDQQTRKPIPCAWIAKTIDSPAANSFCNHLSKFISVTTNSNGMFELKNLDPKPYQLDIQACGYEKKTIGLEAKPTLSTPYTILMKRLDLTEK